MGIQTTFGGNTPVIMGWVNITGKLVTPATSRGEGGVLAQREGGNYEARRANEPLRSCWNDSRPTWPPHPLVRGALFFAPRFLFVGGGNANLKAGKLG